MSESPLEETITVEMSDTDMARFIHFARVVEKFEIGQRLVMEEVGLTYQGLFDRGIGTPVVNVECDYRSPMMYGDELTLEASVDDLSEKTMTLGIRLKNDETVTAEGTITSAFYDIEAGTGTAIPRDIRTKLRTIENAS